MKNILDLDYEDLKKGYGLEGNHYVCSCCGKVLDIDEIYPVEDHFMNARKAMELHIQRVHGNPLDILLGMDKKYVSLTDVQLNVLKLISEGRSDKEIAEISSVTPSTIRHQRFAFREKAKQAKLYCAIYDTVFKDTRQMKNLQDEDSIIEIHDTAKMVDARFVISEKEVQDTLEVMFTSLAPLRLKVFPAKEKKKIIVLRKIVEEFEKNKRYSEVDLNKILKEVYHDFPTIRRYMIEYGFMDRTKNCKEYWRK